MLDPRVTRLKILAALIIAEIMPNIGQMTEIERSVANLNKAALNLLESPNSVLYSKETEIRRNTIAITAPMI